MYVVGGHGYVGSRAVAYAIQDGAQVVVVSQGGDARRGVESIRWSDFLSGISATSGQESSIVWLLDGAKHNEQERLSELLDAAGRGIHITAASSCTVYGDAQGSVCDEDAPMQLVTANAQLKASCESALAAGDVSWSSLRLGALYGVDERGVRRDRIEKWVREAAETGTVTVPDHTHWRGWLHHNQAARAMYRAAARRSNGIFNVASSNATFAGAAAAAAAPFEARVVSSEKPDPMNYQISSEKAYADGLLDELEDESFSAEVESFRLRSAQQDS